jgi:hypothetical protein
MVLVYLGERFIKRIYIFLYNWYIKGTRKYFYSLINFLRRLDRFFAWKITLKNIFVPLYKDYTFQGYVLGFIFRTVRLIIGSLTYLFIIAISLFIYLLWLFLPLYLFLYFLGLIN